jgi:hypothetical protein
MPGTLFAVQRIRSDEVGGYNDWLRDPTGEIIKVFRKRESAEAFRQEWERRERLTHNPFRRSGMLSDYTSMAPAIFRDWLLDADLKPLPVKEKRASVWRDWWDQQSRRLTEQQRHHVWEGLDKAHLLKIIEVELLD